MKGKKLLALTLTSLMAVSLFAGCGGSNSKESSSSEKDKKSGGKKDVVTALLPPVSATYQEKITSYVDDFNKENPDIEIEVTTASWEDMTQKLDVQVNAGSPPDVAFMDSTGISKYVDTGMAVDISKYLDEKEMSDFDESVINYFKSGDGLYGLPAYCEVHCIGGNQELLEKAGIDWREVQKSGWTYDEFREDIKKGVIKEGDQVKSYGFLFACAGITAKDYFGIFVKNAGMPAAFDKDLKYAYTSKKMLSFLKDLRSLIDDGSMPKELGSIDAGKRWNMMLTGQTMITGKGMANFERSAKENTQKLENKDKDAVEGSIPLEYIILPVPVFDGGEQQAQAAVGGYMCFSGKKKSDENHLKNVAKAAYYLASGERAANTCQELYLKPVCETGRTANDKLPPIEGRNEDNEKAADILTSEIAEARPDIPADKGAKAIKIEDEVISPKFQGLLSGEVTPEEMYQAILDAGHDAFGEEDCISD